MRLYRRSIRWRALPVAEAMCLVLRAAYRPERLIPDRAAFIRFAESLKQPSIEERIVRGPFEFYADRYAD